jgi:hypothetical protein
VSAATVAAAARRTIICPAPSAGNVAAVPRFGRRNPEREWEVALAAALEDLAAAGDTVGVLDVDVQSPGVPEPAAERFGAVMLAFMRAGEQLERADGPPALVAVGEALEQTRYEIACTQALLEGAALPDHSAPCVFDPAHGPSVQEVPWAPGDAEDRIVPACAADAARVIGGEHPHIRLIAPGGGRPAYYWDVPSSYRSLLEGGYAQFGGAQRLTQLLSGTPLGEVLRTAAS